jgi:hypothetical protein
MRAGALLFFAKERSGFCAKQLCAPRHSFFLDFKLATQASHTL